MTKETARRIAGFASDTEIQKWSGGIGKYMAEVQTPLLNAERNVCNNCPFRNNVANGGCIGEDCPVFAVRKVFNLCIKRTRNGVRDICKSKYAARVKKWASS